MRRGKRLPNDVLERVENLPAFLEARPAVVFGYLFGGLARGAAAPLSDVDLAVYLRPEAADDPAGPDRLTAGLERVLGTDEIDLVILNRAPLSLTGRILRSRRVLVDRDPFLRHRWESLTNREFMDFIRLESATLERRFARG